MDVLSLEHHFGREIETSIQQLFTFFCNNINLGQWQIVKACLKQLHSNKKNLKFDFNEILENFVQNSQKYSYGSSTLNSPYHLSLLMYEFCIENEYLERKSDLFYDRLIFKFIIYSTFAEDKGSIGENIRKKSDASNASSPSSLSSDVQTIVNELIIFLNDETTKTNGSVSMESSSLSLSSVTSIIDLGEISETTFNYLKQLFIDNSTKAICLVELIFKHNRSNESTFLRAHLASINHFLEILNDKEENVVSHKICKLLNLLSIYDFRLQEKSDKLSSKIENNTKQESVALLQRCFRELCYKFYLLWNNDYEKLDQRFRDIYSSLLYDLDSDLVESDKVPSSKINLLNLFAKIHYETDNEKNVSNTFNDYKLPILSMIKSHSNSSQKETSYYLWRKFFIFCYMENKILLRSVIDECLLLIERNQFDNLITILNIKEFLNLKPLILLIGISKVQDMQSAKKLVASICLNCEKGSLIDKIGNLVKTHLDFISWFQLIKGENRKKEIIFNDLIRLLHKQLPLNIINQYIDITKIEYSEMTKILKNTLTDKDTSKKTKWVRFVDEVNEKISLIQENCLAIYNGFYCINQIIEAILYSCENINEKLNINSSKIYSKNSDPATSLEKLQAEYNQQVVERLESIKIILNQLKPMNYRCEILENIYSLIYLSSNHLKEDDNDNDDTDGEENEQVTNEDPNLSRDQVETNDDRKTKLNEFNEPNISFNDEYEIVSESAVLNKDAEGAEFSIYATSGTNSRYHKELQNQSSKSTLGSFCSYGGSSVNSKGRRHRHGSSLNGNNDEDDETNYRNKQNKINNYRLNAGGGGSFLINDFMCRDILLILKELLIKTTASINLNNSSKNSSTPNSKYSTYGSPLKMKESLHFPDETMSQQREISARLSKLQQLVDDTFWRFELIKLNEIQIEYGKISLLESKSARISKNDLEENLVYDIIKERKLNAFNNMTSNIPLQSPTSSSSKHENFLALQNATNELFNSNIQNRQHRRSTLGSQRSLSLIYPLNKHKRTNLTVMKLLASIETLSTICLKDSKYTEANQLYKMYMEQDKESLKNCFEFNQIKFRSIYEQTQDDLIRFNKKFLIDLQLKKSKEINSADSDSQKQKNLMSLSMQSLDLVKLTESLLSFESENRLLQCIFVCDLILMTKINLSLSSSLVDFANVRLNQDTIDSKNESLKSSTKKRFSRQKSRSDDEDSEKEINEKSLFSLNDHQNELSKFDEEMRIKLSKFIEYSQIICNHFMETSNFNEDENILRNSIGQKLNSLANLLFDFGGISLSLANNGSKHASLETIKNSIEKFESFYKLNKKVNDLKQNFEASPKYETENLNEIFINLINLLNESIHLNENEDVVSVYFYKLNAKYPPVSLLSSEKYVNLSNSYGSNTTKQSELSASIEKFIHRSDSINIQSQLGKNSNYLLSFYEYCKTLYEYFKEKNIQNTETTPSLSLSNFSILNSSPASLICKLLFEDCIKPHLLETLTHKLNLNLTAIILHNSCPRLKLTVDSHNSLFMQLSTPEDLSNESQEKNLTKNSNQILARQVSFPASKSRANTLFTQQNSNNKLYEKETVSGIASSTNLYNQNSFYTVLNESETTFCSIKKPDDFIRDLLSKLLKYLENFLKKTSSDTIDNEKINATLFNSTNKVNNDELSSIDLKIAQDIYKCAEFKSILNETQELQNLNLTFLKTDNQRLSFFINLYNFLCIHSHFYMASITCLSSSSSSSTTKAENEPASSKSICLFKNKAESLLFQQRVCYKVGQMGIISLFDLKHHILIRRCLHNDNPHNFKNANVSLSQLNDTQTIKTENNKKNKSKGQQQQQQSSQITKNDKKRLSEQSNNSLLPLHDNESLYVEPLYKYCYYKLDLDAEPLWSQYLPSEKVCDYRILFALINCTESDSPICVYNSDELLNDQLQMQMKLFLNDSIFVDLCDDLLYLPSFLVENCSFFNYSNQSNANQSNISSSAAEYVAKIDNNFTKDDLNNLIKFLVENVNKELKESLEDLLNLDSIHDFGENIDQYGQKELPFPIEKIPDSNKFSLIIRYNYRNSSHGSNVSELTTKESLDKMSWYRKYRATLEIKKQKLYNSKNKTDLNDTVNLKTSISETTNSGNETISSINDKTMNDSISGKDQLTQDCLDYIQKNSPLISDSLSFLFDAAKRVEFFKLLSDNADKVLASNSLNRFIQLYVPLNYMKHLSMKTKLNLITQFLLTNKTEESKIELIIDLANYYCEKQEWSVVLNLLNNCTQDNEELNDLYDVNNLINSINNGANNKILDFKPNNEQNTNSLNCNNGKNMLEKNSRFSQKDLYNLYDHACVCQAFQESKTNEKSYLHLFKMKNFLRQVRSIFGLMHIWPIDSCLEMIDYCLNKSKLIEQSFAYNTNENESSMLSSLSVSESNGPCPTDTNLPVSNTNFHDSNHFTNCHKCLIKILNEKKAEFIAYKELTRCARLTLEKYYEHQQIQDAAGFYDELLKQSGGYSTNNINQAALQTDSNQSTLSRLKKTCQKCLTWQYAKTQLESSSINDEETNESIMDLFLLNNQFTCAKYLIKKLNLNRKLQFKLDFGHLKHRLQNLNAASSIIVIDFESILRECVSFEKIENNNFEKSEYLFDICYKLINELKDLNELNNQVLISLCDFLITNYSHLINELQINEFRIIQLTAKIFQVLVQDRSLHFDSYKRHHSNPLLIIEQLLMNSHIDLCSKTIIMCRESINDLDFHVKINQLLLKYARKALEFRIFINKNETASNPATIETKSYSPQNLLTKAAFSNFNKKRMSVAPIDVIITSSSSTNNSIASSPTNLSSISTSFKAFHKVNTSANSQLSSSFGISNLTSLTTVTSSNFVMPLVPPNKEDWVKDEEVQDCMVCNVKKFSLLNRRHHCRRCGRVVCFNCSQKMTLIDNLLQRTCDDCFKQIELQNSKNTAEQQAKVNELNDAIEIIGNGIRKIKLKQKNMEKEELNSTKASIVSTANDESNISWQLIGGNENETSQKRDDQIRSSFRYQQAPSTSLCLSILDLHDQPSECGKDLLNMCDELSNYLQTANYQVEDFALIINMIKHLLHNAKVKLLQNSSTNMISMCDTYLSLIDILEQLLLANCSYIPSLNELRNTETARRIRNRLLEEERYELAMNFSTKCGLDTQSVWASWGLIELRRGNYKEARNKFEKCLKPITDKSSSVSPAQLKVVYDVISYFENAAPIKMMGPQTLLAPLRSVELLIAEPKLFSNADSRLDEIQLKESIYYLETYGNYSLIISFYQRHGFLEKAFQYLVDKKCSSDVFVESLLTPCLKTGEFYQLLEYMFNLERYQNKLSVYYVAIGKHLEKNGFSNTLYDFQLQMKDFVRACMSCICFFTRNCASYFDLFNNLHYLSQARNHLEQYLEICSIKQQYSSSQQSSMWKQNKLVEQQPQQQTSLNKQMSTQEIDNYLNAINLQIEVTKFINSCKDKEKIMSLKKLPTLFGSNDSKIQLCCLILLSGQSIQEGFGFVIRIIQCFNLNSTLVYSQIARELAKTYNFKEINNLLKCINESGYKDDVNSSYDECISTCIRVFAADNTSTLQQDSNSNSNIYSNLQQQQNQYNKEIEELIQLIKSDENKINAYILNGRLKSAYLIAIKMDRTDIVKHIANVAERMGQHLIKDICNKWLEKKAALH